MQALSRCLAAASQQQQQQGEAEEGGAFGLVQQLMFNLAKKGVTAANLAVRQVSFTNFDIQIYIGVMQQCCVPHMLGILYMPACGHPQHASAWQIVVLNWPSETSHQPGLCRKNFLAVYCCSNTSLCLSLVSKIT